jgi:hypothetical protein
LHHDGTHASTLAALASLNSIGISATETIALSANSLALDLHFSLLAVVQVFKADLKLDCCRLDFLLSTTAATLSLTAAHSKQVENVSHA